MGAPHGSQYTMFSGLLRKLKPHACYLQTHNNSANQKRPFT